MKVVDVSARSFRVRALKFVNDGKMPGHVDLCTLRAAVLKVPLRMVKFMFGDLWVMLAGKSGALCAGILSFLAGAFLVGLSWGLYVVDPEILVKMWIFFGAALGMCAVIIAVAVALALLSENNRTERMLYTVADSKPGKVVGTTAKGIWVLLKWPLMPFKWSFYDLLWLRVFREDDDAVFITLIVIALVLFVGAILFILVYNLIFNTFLALLGLCSALGLLVIIGFIVLFFAGGWYRAIRERVCNPVNIVD